MPTLSLPIQLASTGANPPPPRRNSAPVNGATQFGQTLSREMAQQQCPAPAQAQAKPADAKPATASADEAKDEAASAASAAADAAANSPAAELLALLASFNPPAVALATPSTPASVASAAGTALGAQAAASAAALAAPALAGSDQALALKGSALAIDGAAGFSLKALGGDAAARGALPLTPKLATGTESLTALSGAAHQPGLDDAAGQVGQPSQVSLVSINVVEQVSAPLQQASLAMAQAASPPERIAARVGTPGWDNQVGQKIIWMVAGKQHSASMTLNPPDMGPMQVVLSVTGEHATVTFSAAQPEVRQALENALPKLRDMLGESGIALGNASVDAGMPDQRQAQQGEAPRRQGLNARFGGADEAAPPAPAAARTARPASAGLVDTFA